MAVMANKPALPIGNGRVIKQAQNGEGLVVTGLRKTQVPDTMVNTVGKTVTEAQAAYLAGLIDADGAIMATIEAHKETRFRFRVRVVVKVTQHTTDVLYWLQDTFGVGRVVQNRTTHDWIVKRQDNVRYVLLTINPYLQVKPKQTALALEILDTNPQTQQEFLQLARQADALSKLNVRSANRRLNTAAMVEVAFSRND